MQTSELTARLQSLQATAPVGLTGLDPMPYGQTRWNGSIWPDIQVDAYNRLLSDIAGKHRAGMDTQNLIDGLYNLAHGFDTAGKPYTVGQTVTLLNTHPGDGGWSSAYVESVHGSTYGVRVQGHSLYYVTADKLDKYRGRH